MKAPKSYQSKDMAYVKSFCGQTNRQMDAQTKGQWTGQQLYAADLSMRGHQNEEML